MVYGGVQPLPASMGVSRMKGRMTALADNDDAHGRGALRSSYPPQRHARSLSRGRSSLALYLVRDADRQSRATSRIRALETLAGADVHRLPRIPRVTRVLLEPLRASTNRALRLSRIQRRRGRCPKLLAALEAGKSVALVSDAGNATRLRPRLSPRPRLCHRGRPPRRCRSPAPSAPLAALVGLGPAQRRLSLCRLPADQGQGDAATG